MKTQHLQRRAGRRRLHQDRLQRRQACGGLTEAPPVAKGEFCNYRSTRSRTARPTPPAPAACRCLRSDLRARVRLRRHDLRQCLRHPACTAYPSPAAPRYSGDGGTSDSCTIDGAKHAQPGASASPRPMCNQCACDRTATRCAEITASRARPAVVLPASSAMAAVLRLPRRHDVRSGDQSGTCKDRPDACTDVIATVCGCDGNVQQLVLSLRSQARRLLRSACNSPRKGGARMWIRSRRPRLRPCRDRVRVGIRIGIGIGIGVRLGDRDPTRNPSRPRPRPRPRQMRAGVTMHSAWSTSTADRNGMLTVLAEAGRYPPGHLLRLVGNSQLLREAAWVSNSRLASGPQFSSHGVVDAIVHAIATDHALVPSAPR